MCENSVGAPGTDYIKKMEENQMKKILAFLLAALMVVGLFAGCAPADNDDTTKAPDSTTAPQGGDETTEPTETPALSADDIPDEMTSEDGKYQIAFVTDVGQLKDKSFNQGTYDGVKLYAAANDLLVASDEIHGGLVLDAPNTYLPLLSLARSDAERRRLIAFVAPSKTWNVPGLGCAFAIVPDPTLREHFTRNYDQLIPAVNLFGWVGAEAAYRHGEPWRLAMLAYLRRNRDLLETFADKHGLPLCKLEATYLGFLDCRALLPKLGGESPRDFFLREAKVALHDGAIFGSPGWVRINIATHTDLLREALDRLSAALERLG